MHFSGMLRLLALQCIMPDAFLQLSETDQSQILRSLGLKLARNADVLEKDVWVCWVLKTLFVIPDLPSMAFKGGTSLSKVFHAINRFSEDVDITLDYRELDGSFDPLDDSVSKTRRKKFSETLKSFVKCRTHDTVLPYFRTQIASEFEKDQCWVDIDENGEQMRVYYRSVLEGSGDYLCDSVLLEFGGRNITEPHEIHDIQPDIAEHIPDLMFPVANVCVLSPLRTFWEKATLIHAECQRKEFRANTKRLSRHWYDLAMLAEMKIGHEAVNNRQLLADVVKHKKVFYHTSYANYDACLNGGLQLIPNNTALSPLHEDYQKMIDAGMFIGQHHAFTNVIGRLRHLETIINTGIAESV